MVGFSVYKEIKYVPQGTVVQEIGAIQDYIILVAWSKKNYLPPFDENYRLLFPALLLLFDDVSGL